MRTTRMLGMTAVLLCGSLILGCPSAFADGAMDPPSGGDSNSSGCCGGHDVDPPQVKNPDPPQVTYVNPPEVNPDPPQVTYIDPPQVKNPDPPRVENFDPPAPPPPPIQQPADPGDDFVKSAAAPVDGGITDPFWVITDFKGRCALAHQPTFELGYQFKGPFTTFGAGAVEMGLLGAPGGWPAPVPPPAPGSPPGPCAAPAAPPAPPAPPTGGATVDPWWIITDFKGKCALAHLPTFELGYLFKGPFTTFGAGAVDMGLLGAPGFSAPATGAPLGPCAG